MESLENLDCPYFQDEKFSQKGMQFVDVTWKSDLFMLSRTEIFAKTSQI